MNSNEVVETSDDDELELRCSEATQAHCICTEQTTRHRSDRQSPRKRRKLYHDFESDTLPFGTPARASSVTWPPTSSSPNTSPKSSSLLQTPPRSHSLSPSISVKWSDGSARSSQDLVHPKLSPKPDDELPPAMSSQPSIFTSEGEPPDIHASSHSSANPYSSAIPRSHDELPTVSSSPPEMTGTELSNIHERSPSSTPSTSSPEARLRSPSPDPLSLFDASPSQPIGSMDLSQQETPMHKDQRVEGLSPRTYVSPHISSQSVLQAPTSPESPLSSAPSSRQRTPLSTPPPAQHSPRNSLPRDSPIPIPDHPPHGPIIQDSEPISTLLDDDDLPNISRYPLRRRAPAQLKPYTVEKYQYKQALSANPDAILNIRDPGRVNREHYDHTDDHVDDSQAPWQPLEETQNDSDNEPRRLQTVSHRENSRDTDPARAVSVERPVKYSELLQDLPSSDEEESKSMQRFSKEAKRLERERRKARLEEERQARLARKESEKAKTHKKPKDFPVEYPSTRSRSVSISSNDSPPSPSCSVTHSDASRLRSRLLLSPPPDTSTQMSSPTSPKRSPSPPHFVDRDSDDFDAQPSIRGPVDLSDPERQSEHSSEVEGDDISPEKMKMPKGAKVLFRMYPISMVKQLAAGSLGASKAKSKMKNQHTKDSSGSEAEEAAVLPGRSRSGWSSRPWNKEIKGDTESSDDQSASDQDSPSDNESVHMQSEFRTRSDRQDVHDVVDLTRDLDEDSDDEDTGEDDDSDEVDDSDIQAYLKGQTSAGRMREGSLIDWMLTRTRTIDGPSRPRTKKRPSDRARSPKRARYNIDVTIQGSRRERQTRLNFTGHTGKKPASHKSRKGNHAPPPRRARSDSVDVETNDERDRVHPVTELDAPPPKKNRKQRERERRARAKGNGLHIFTSDSTHLISGRRKRPLMSMNVEEDDGFSRAIAPLSQDLARPLQSARIANTDHKEPVSERRPSPGYQPITHEQQEPRHLLLDCGIEVLQSGLSLSPNSYIRKGWLYELIGVIRGEQRPLPPAKVIFHGIELGPDSSVDDFIKSLKQVFDQLFDIVTSLYGVPDIGEEQEWRVIQRAVNQSLSWLLVSTTETDIELLRTTVQEQISIFVSRMRDQSLNSSSLDTFTLSICWFAVEMSARLDLPTKFATSSAVLGKSVPLLMNYLWGHGVESVMASLKEGAFHNCSVTAQYVAELWVSLFHLLDSRNIPDDSSKKAVHPFSFFLQETLESTPRPSKHPLKASEWVWHSIFSLCAMTQFSVHGMTTSASRLPASWELIVYALKQVRLTVNGTADRALSQQSLHQRDIYAKWITERCFLLRSRWHWQLDDVSNVLDRLSKVFQTRNFAGLHHERRKHDYPFFLIHNDWSVFAKLEPEDTGFIVFLKLLFQAVSCDEMNAHRSLSPKAKKMLSMAISVTKLPFSKKTPTAVQDLSMLHNRLSAVAVAIHLDPASHVQRMKTARSYVDFSDANETTRWGVIQGMVYLAIMLKKARLPIDSISHWVGEMATTLGNESKALGENALGESEGDHKRISNWLRVLAEVLVGAVRQILQAFQADSEYPEFALLEAIDPIIKAPNLANQLTMGEQIRQMLQAFLDARKRALIPYERPISKPTTRESQESQDDYPTMDIDYDDPDLLAALDAYDPEIPIKEASELTNKEEKLKAYIRPVSWWVWRKLYKRVTDSASFTKSDYIQIEIWLECWLGCADVMIHAGHTKGSWQSFLSMRDYWKDLSESMRKRLDFSFMKRLLKIDPMTYSGHENMYLETLLTALVSKDPMNERDFIRLVLDMDGYQHPLLVGLSTEELADHPNEQEPSDILRGIIRNIAGRLADMTTSPDERDELIELCIKILQAMKRNSSELTPGSPERQKYNTWCQGIAQTVQSYRELDHERLSPWRNWERELG